METLDQNGERGRAKTGQRRRWAKVLIRPRTLKLVIGVGRWTIRVLQLVHAILKVF